MAASERTNARTASTCTAGTARGTHVFKIADYSLHRGLGAGEFVRSATFAVGGYDWCIRYYPDGDGRHDDGNRGDTAVHVELMTKNAKVRALFEFSLVDHQLDGEEPLVVFLDHPAVFNTIQAGENVWGTDIMSPSDLEKSPYLRDDCLVLECEVTVVKETRVAVVAEVQVPSSCLLDNLGKLLGTREGADVTFKVKGDAFPAHKIILAMQSPVLRAELYGPMRDTSGGSIAVEDMEPAVFKALLHFVYTDALPSMDDLQGGDKEEMVKHLLVAADRYGMERMKVMCESILSKSLDVENVAATLALADQHHCSNLKDACIEFMYSSHRMDDVVETQGYEDLKRSRPVVLVDVLERATKSRKI